MKANVSFLTPHCVPLSVLETDGLHISYSWSAYTFPHHPGAVRVKNDQPTCIRACMFTGAALINNDGMQLSLTHQAAHIKQGKVQTHSWQFRAASSTATGQHIAY